MSNRIGLIEDKQLVSILNDSDRFNDISLFIYEQNKDLYIKYFKCNKSEEANLESSYSQANKHKMNYTNEMKRNNIAETKICTIL